MDNRVLMWIAAAMIWIMVYQAWQRDYHPRTPVQAANTVADTAEIPGNGEAPPTLSDAPPELSGAVVNSPTDSNSANDTALVAQTQQIRVITDVYDLLVDPVGVKIHSVKLLAYPVAKDTPDTKVMLLDANSRSATSLQTGLLASGGAASPTHDRSFETAQTEYTMGADAEKLDVVFNWAQDGVVVEKVLTFYPGRYNIDLTHRVQNGSAASWSGAQYAQLKGSGLGAKRSMVDVDSYSFVGTVVYDGDSYEKYDLKDLRKEPLSFETTEGWIANIRHHFVAAVIPPADETVQFKSRTPNDNTTLVSGVAPLHSIAAGSSGEFKQKLFIGPKLQDQMAETANGLKLSVDYGFLTVIAQPVFWLLNKIHSLVGNWGLAIILLTVLIKLLFYPLAEKAGRSMAKQRAVAPRLKAIQERYKDDKQALSKAMMELYKKEQINPASGCLPLLIQMPVFLALYWVLIESVELRQAPFFGWIQDLSSRDPYFILPIMMAVAMFVQTKLNPKPPDPTMARVMTIMPIVMSIFFVFFPAGLVLYWVVNTVLSVLQQWRINKVVGAT